ARTETGHISFICTFLQFLNTPFKSPCPASNSEAWLENVRVRENPTSVIVRFAGGSVEPAHYHTHGHDVVVIKGEIGWNSSKSERFELGIGDYLFTPGGDVHRVKYLEGTEMVIRRDRVWDIEFARFSV
nr:DNA damage-repair/toleration protein DRT102 [Tanacetum cinerariifolium]